MALCNRCTEIIVTAKGMVVTMALTVDEMVHFVHTTLDEGLRERLLQAIGLVDPDTEDRTRRELP